MRASGCFGSCLTQNKSRKLGALAGYPGSVLLYFDVVWLKRVAEVHTICNRHGLSLYSVATPTLLTLYSYLVGRRINGRSPPSSPRGVGLTTAWHEPTRAEEKKEEAINELKVQYLQAKPFSPDLTTFKCIPF